MEEDKADLLIPGEILNYEFSEHQEKINFIEQEISEIFELLSSKQYSANEFIGAHPITMTEKTLQMVSKERKDFLLCEKTDGIRYIMLILSNGQVYLTGRQMGSQRVQQKQFFLCNFNIPNIFNYQNYNSGSFMDGTYINFLFDGELVNDYYNGQKITKFLIFDTIIYQKNFVGNQNYVDRLKYAEKFQESCQSFNKILEQKEDNKKNYQIVVKDFFETNPATVKYILNEYKNILPHKNDGLIFSRISTPYQSGKNESFLKWKPANLNSIDFLLVPNKKFKILFNRQFNEQVIDLYVNNWENGESQRVFFDQMQVERQLYQQIQSTIDELFQNNKGMTIFGLVAECVFDFDLQNKYLEHLNIIYKDEQEIIENIIKNAFYTQKNNQKINQQLNNLINFQKNNSFKGGWKLSNLRLDKSDPNAQQTAINIQQSIFENLDEEALVQTLKKQNNLPTKKIKIE